MSQKCPICPDIIWDMCYSMLIISVAVLLFALFVDLDRTTRIMDLTKPYDCNSIVLLIV